MIVTGIIFFILNFSNLYLFNNNIFNNKYEIVRVQSFLGNEKRNFYGVDPPEKLNLIWKIYLGGGITNIPLKGGERKWYGCGWTGQPLIVEENSIIYLIIGAYDHNLKKIDSRNGNIIWQYKFDDIIKGTGTICLNTNAEEEEEKIIIIQGSRRGVDKTLSSQSVPSLRAISYFTGEEIWRFNVKLTHSYSRDVDGSALIYDEKVFIGLENGIFTIIDPYEKAINNDYYEPEIINEFQLYTQEDYLKHGGNLVIESSPCLLGDHIYISSGSGHIYGYNLNTDSIDWEYYIGSDIDGSPVVTYDNCLLVTIEKQYISGKGGILKLDPKYKNEKAVVWFFPTGNKNFADWQGGIIGSPSVNDNYIEEDSIHLAAFTGIDGYLYIVEHDKFDINNEKVLGPNNLNYFRLPKLVNKTYIGPSISTPLIFKDKIIAASYNGIYLFHYNDGNISLIEKKSFPFEATPIVWNRKIYIGSRDGFLYCFGDL